MLKETDLRIGNVIYYETSEDGLMPNKVDWQDLKWLSENEKSFNESFKPIPISLVTLLKLGWSIFHDGGDYHLLSKQVGEWGLFVIQSDGNGLSYVHTNSSVSRKIKYYHELQNVFFFASGVELSNTMQELEISNLVEQVLSDGHNVDELPF